MKIGLVWTYLKLKDDTINLIKEISPYLDKVYVLIDTPQDKLYISNVEYIHVPNEWFDIGKFYNFFKKWIYIWDELLLTNSTVSPVSSLDKLMKFIQSSDLDVIWATSAYTEWSGAKSVKWYHLQSFFLYIKGKAVKDTIDYYKEHW